MKIFASLMMMTLLAVSAWGASAVDGKWKVEPKAGAKDKEGKQAAVLTLDLKSEGDKLTGSLTRTAKRDRSTGIENGKVEGNKFSFTTSQQNRKKGTAVKTVWEGTVEDGQITGTMTPEGRKRGASFTAKKVN